MYVRSAKSRENPRLEKAKEHIRHELHRDLSDHEEYMIELSEALLDSDGEERDDDLPKAA